MSSRPGTRSVSRGSRRATWLALLRQLAPLSSVAVTALGMAVLVSWYLGAVEWTRLRGAVAPVRIDTAAALVIGGLGIVALHAGWRRTGVALGTAVTGVVLLSALDQATGLGLLPTWLLSRPAPTMAYSPYMAPNTAVALALAGLAIALLGLGHVTFAALLFGAFVLSLGVVLCLGHFIGAPEAFVWGPFNDIALLTALAIAATGVGIMAVAYARVRPRPARIWWSPLIAGLCVGLIGILFSVALTERQSRQFREIVWATGSAVLGEIEHGVAMRTRAFQYMAADAARAPDSGLPSRWDAEGLRILRDSFPGLRRLEWFGPTTAVPELVFSDSSPVRARSAAERRLLRQGLDYVREEGLPATLAPFDVDGRDDGVALLVPVQRPDGTRDVVAGYYETDVSLLDSRILAALGAELEVYVIVGERVLYPAGATTGLRRATSVAFPITHGGPQSWQLLVTPTESLRAAYTSQLPELILGMSVLIALLLGLTAQFAREETIRADLANAAKDSFIAVLGHELRNPLMAIWSAVEVLRRKRSDADRREALDAIERQLVCVTDIVDDLLEISRVVSGKFSIDRHPLELNALLQDAVSQWQAQAERARLDLTFDASGAPVWVDADGTRIRQIVGNLLSNAIKFTPAGGRIEVSVAHEEGAGEARVSVRDTGRGLAPGALDRIFEPFGHANSEGAGLGLGLAIATGLVTAHGGRLTARSAGPGKGSEFVFSLPLTRAPARQQERAAADRGSPEARILVVEDHVDSATMLSELLAMDGHDVEVAHDGASGVEKARSFHPDLVICDLGLPVMDGYETARALRNDAATRRARLVALTGFGNDEAIEKAHAAGFDRHLLKPIDPDDLRSTLDALLRPGAGTGDNGNGGNGDNGNGKAGAER